MRENRIRKLMMAWLILMQMILITPWMAITACAADTSSISIPCDSPHATALPLVLDGEGEFCHITSGTISSINSWNMQLVEINGVNYTNNWSDKMPEKLDGKYYIYSVGAVPWSHLEVNGSSGDDPSEPDDLPDQCPGACNAATPVYPTITEDGGSGNITMYTTGASSGGACNYGTTDVMYFAASNVNIEPGDGLGNWQGGSICGQCAEITTLTSQGLKKVVVRIMDKCPDGHCGMDLGGEAPALVMPDGYGRYDGQWRFVSCDGHPEVSDGPPTLDVLAGSNLWWSRVHVRNGSMAVDTIEWQSDDGSSKGRFPFAKDPENAFEVPVNEVLQSPSSFFRITVYYRDGSTAEVTLSPIELSIAGASYALD